MWVGAELTLYGMGLVFLLLAVLWGLIALLTRLDRPPAADAAGAEEAAGSSPAAVPVAAAAAPALDHQTLAAVVIACRAHRMTRRKQAAPEMRTHQPGSLPSRWVGTGRTRQNRSWAPGGKFA
jgi:Na+-transporting methylmalonyl-CoA/oxaloacetate decarboxylase gamma subunit